MNDIFDTRQWFAYQETPMKKTAPVKLDRILAARMEAFIRAKNVRTMSLD